MQLVTGVVQLLVFQHLALLMARAKPIKDIVSLHTYASKCNDSVTSIMSQIHSQIMDMHSEAKECFDTYARCQNFHSENIINLCDPKDLESSKFSLNRTSSEEDELSEMYKIFHYMNTAIGNITHEQKNLNPKNKSLHQQLNTSKTKIAAVISNLFCVLSKRYKVPQIDMYYTKNSTGPIILKKKNGCKVLNKYKSLLTQAVKITSDWKKNGEYSQDPFLDKQTPDHR
ncbi:leukemia inhibitory factor [Rhinoderma darwinii]|uniref:leukemia inhibitory factor n=1 Tax=Rhinoderma darwinii TaxID=43563 RepID=UPI003F661FB4